ncbi:hypothetical protein DFH06DRAFT_1120610 [Mycena polygramma]|nr:hypothetical protein DFH06DRAFT_1120610 [Mycena polygramma]
MSRQRKEKPRLKSVAQAVPDADQELPNDDVEVGHRGDLARQSDRGEGIIVDGSRKEEGRSGGATDVTAKLGRNTGLRGWVKRDPGDQNAVEIERHFWAAKQSKTG